MKNQNMLKKENAITLIVLVITIVILLILAGVVIASLTNTGILEKTNKAKEKTDYSSALEEINLKINEAAIEQKGNLTLVELEEFLSKDDEVDVMVTRYNEIAKKSEKINEYPTGKLENIVVNVVKYEKYYFLIGENCKVLKVSNDDGNNFVDINKFNFSNGAEAKNDNWKKILNLAQIDFSQFDNYEEALKNENVQEEIIKNNTAVGCLINSTDDIIDVTVNNKNMLNKLAKNEYSAEKIISDENWYKKIEESPNSMEFFENLNIKGTETLNLSDEKNPYYTFEAKANKKYFIQCYGAQGGSYYNYNPGGYGGYTFGTFSAKENTKLYIYIGGEGTGSIPNDIIPGGYNGGGAVASGWADGNEKRASGGGATHIALVPGLLSSLENNKADIIMVAGGGGGSGANSVVYDSTNGFGGNGGGTEGTDGKSNKSDYGTGGTQTTAGRDASFGKGGESTHGLLNGGGAGWYGGGTGWLAAGGGSGYINPAFLQNAKTLTSNHTGNGECRITEIK